MEILKDEDIHLRFILGSPIHVEGIGDFSSPLLKDIVEITEDKYDIAISTLLFDKNSLELNVSEDEELTDFQTLNYIIYHNASYKEAFFCGLGLHFNKFPEMSEEGYIYFDELNEYTVLTDEKFDYIKKLTRIGNNIGNNTQMKKEDEIVAGNDQARKFMEEQKRKKALLASLKKPKRNLHSIISAVGWKSQTFDFINNLNIYQLYDGYSRFQMIDNYQHTLGGIYAGTVDGSKIKIEDINWANIF